MQILMQHSSQVKRASLSLLCFCLALILPVQGICTDSDPVQALHNWAKAWSNKDFNAYLQAYTAEYKGRTSSHQQWLQQRRSRILRPGSIRVKLDAIEVKSKSDKRIIIYANQQYQSPHFNDKVIKRFDLIRINGQWKINQERTIEKL